MKVPDVGTWRRHCTSEDITLLEVLLEPFHVALPDH